MVKYDSICPCRANTSYNRTISPKKRKFYSSYAWQKLRNRKVNEHPYVREVGVSGTLLLLKTYKVTI